MGISAIENSGVYRAPAVQKAAPASPPAEESRIVPEERAFDRYEPEDSAEITICDTGKVDRELENLRKERDQLEQQLRSAAPEQAEDIRRQLDNKPAGLTRRASLSF